MFLNAKGVTADKAEERLGDLRSSLVKAVTVAIGDGTNAQVEGKEQRKLSLVPRAWQSSDFVPFIMYNHTIHTCTAQSLHAYSITKASPRHGISSENASPPDLQAPYYPNSRQASSETKYVQLKRRVAPRRFSEGADQRAMVIKGELHDL